MAKRSTPPDEIQEVLIPPDDEKENIPCDGGSSLPADSFKLSHPLGIVAHNKPSRILKDAKPPTTAAKDKRPNSDKSTAEKKFEQFPESSVRYYCPPKHQDSSDEESDFEWLPFPNPFRKRTEEDLRTRRFFTSRANRGLDNPQNVQLPVSLNVNDSEVGFLEEAKTVVLPDAVPTMNRSEAPIDTADSDGPVLSMGTEKLNLMDELLDEALHK